MRIIFIAIAALAFSTMGCKIMPHNSMKDCRAQCKDNAKPAACMEFCNCIHEKGEALNKCLEAYERHVEDSSKTR